jgi:tRNA U34 5-methylaminomethyl-2-thiouridine-forming methyltransferase MnmC
MIRDMNAYHHWQHFLALEADFAATSRYVEFAEQNFPTFSVEYAKLLLAIGSEIDVLCKMICEKADSKAKRGYIDDYRACLTAHTQMTSEKVLIRRYQLRL